MAKEEIYKASDVLNTILDNYLHGGEAAEVVTKFEDELIKSNLTKEEPKECMYSKDSYTDEDRKVLCDGCEEDCKYNKKETVNNNCLLNRKEPSIPDIVDEHFYEMLGEEPISEDLGEYIDKLSKQFPEVSFAKLSRIAVRVAKWQKQKDDGEIKMVRELLADFDKHCDEYHEAGFKHGQEALMKDATETTVHIGAGNYPYIPQIELYDYDKDVPLAKEGDMYKVVLIKED